MARQSGKKSTSRNIVLLSDGTGNSAAKFNKTNVWRTYEALDLGDASKQLAIYDDGVGTETFKPMALAGGAIGLGLSRNVRELYAFLCRNYREGDRIFGFGFSRGAFTIRTLAGLICTFGVLKVDPSVGEADLRRKIRLVYRAYRKGHSSAGTDPAFAAIVRSVRDSFPRQRLPDRYLVNGKANPDYFHDVEIAFLGLWDTVDAYGFPLDEMREGWDKWVWPLSMRNYNLSSKVKRAVHALCLDDERNTFHPLLWNEDGDDPYSSISSGVRQDHSKTNVKDEVLSQVWFAGMHADVGGGYPDDFLAYVPLVWVLDQARAKGLAVKDEQLADYRKAANACGTMHDSRRGLAAYYRLLPRDLTRICDSRRRTVRWRKGFAPERPRYVHLGVVKVERPKIHHTVFDRMSAMGRGYAPIVLPETYAVVDAKNNIIDAAEYGAEPAGGAPTRAAAQQRVWDFVWLRRVFYFTTVFLTACLVSLPWMTRLPLINWIPGLDRAVEGDKCVNSMFCFLSFLPRLLDGFLPAVAKTWVDSFVANPGIFGVLATAIFTLMAASNMVDTRIRDRMHAVWRPEKPLATRQTILTKLRSSGLYLGFFVALKHYLLPLMFGLASLVTIIYGGITVLSRTTFAIADARGSFCAPPIGPPYKVGMSYSRPLAFDPKAPCWPTNLTLEKGAAYRIVMTIDKETWKDGDIPADVGGITGSMHWYLQLFSWPNKRYPFEPYLKPVARITPGKNIGQLAAGQDEYVLNQTFAHPDGEGTCLVSDIVTKSEGELFLFVNDSVLWFLPDFIVKTYANNGGPSEAGGNRVAALVHVRRISAPGQAFEAPVDVAGCEEMEEIPAMPTQTAY